LSLRKWYTKEKVEEEQRFYTYGEKEEKGGAQEKARLAQKAHGVLLRTVRRGIDEEDAPPRQDDGEVLAHKIPRRGGGFLVLFLYTGASNLDLRYTQYNHGQAHEPRRVHPHRAHHLYRYFLDCRGTSDRRLDYVHEGPAAGVRDDRGLPGGAVRHPDHPAARYGRKLDRACQGFCHFHPEAPHARRRQ